MEARAGDHANWYATPDGRYLLFSARSEPTGYSTVEAARMIVRCIARSTARAGALQRGLPLRHRPAGLGGQARCPEQPDLRVLRSQWCAAGIQRGLRRTGQSRRAGRGSLRARSPTTAPTCSSTPAIRRAARRERDAGRV